MKKAVAILLTVVMLAAVLPFYSFADFESGATRRLSLPVLEKELWEALEGVRSITKRSSADTETIYASAEDGSSSARFKVSFEPMDLSEYRELAIRLAVRGNEKSYPVSVKLSSEKESLIYSLTVSDDIPVIYIPLESAVSGALTDITFTVGDSGTRISYIMINGIDADDTYTYSYKETFSATDVISENRLLKSPEDVTLYPEGGAGSLSPLFTSIPGKDRDVLVWLRLDGTRAGSLTVKTTYVNGEGEEKESKDYHTTPKRSDTPGILSFTVPGGFESIAFEFSGLSADDPIAVFGGGCADMGERESEIGSIASCQYDGKEITVSGTLSTDASLKYLGSKLLLFRIPANETDTFDEKSAKPVAQGGFSTKFTLSYDCDNTYAGYFYKVFLDTSEGLRPVGSLCAANCKATPAGAVGDVSCLYGADAADVFESGASSVILDVYAGKLLENEDIYSAEVYNMGSAYHFNKDYLSAIDKDIRFFTSAAVSVYIRLYSDKEGYAFDYTTDDPRNLSLMSAVCSFLSERYPTVSGFIAGPALNIQGADTPEFAEEKARLIAVFAECIKTKNSNAAVILPFSESERADCSLSVSMLSYYLGKYSAPSVTFMLEGLEGVERLSESAQRIALVAAQQKASVDGSSVLWRVPSSTDAKGAADTYHRLCDRSASLGLRFFCADLSAADRSSELYDGIKNRPDKESSGPSAVSRFEASFVEKEFSGSYPLWDFTSSYDTAGWVGGGSFSSPISAKGSFGTRVLFAGAAENGGAGILIGKTDSPVNMKDLVAKVTFCVTSKMAEKAEISLIFGSGNRRAEFSAVAECNSNCFVLCDMSDFSGAESIDYVSLIVRNAPDGGAELSKIELCSEDLTDEELKTAHKRGGEEEHDPILYALIIIVAAVTVTVFSVLMRKQKRKRRGSER